MGYTPNYSHLVGIMIINHWENGVHCFQTNPNHIWICNEEKHLRTGAGFCPSTVNFPDSKHRPMVRLGMVDRGPWGPFDCRKHRTAPKCSDVVFSRIILDLTMFWNTPGQQGFDIHSVHSFEY